MVILISSRPCAPQLTKIMEYGTGSRCLGCRFGGSSLLHCTFLSYICDVRCSATPTLGKSEQWCVTMLRKELVSHLLLLTVAETVLDLCPSNVLPAAISHLQKDLELYRGTRLHPIWCDSVSGDIPCGGRVSVQFQLLHRPSTATVLDYWFHVDDVAARGTGFRSLRSASDGSLSERLAIIIGLLRREFESCHGREGNFVTNRRLDSLYIWYIYERDGMFTSRTTLAHSM